MFQINGYTLPSPARGLTEQRQQKVVTGTNALGQMVAQKISRWQLRFDSLTWPYLSTEEWSLILREIEKFEGILTFYDAVEGSKKTIRVYWGDASAQPYWLDDGGRPTAYTNCTCSIMDMGYDQ